MYLPRDALLMHADSGLASFDAAEVSSEKLFGGTRRANDLPEANAIDAEVRAAQARVDELQHPPSELRARVIRQRAYRYGHWDTPDIRAVKLLPGGQMTRGGEGGADAGLWWSVRDEGGVASG